MGPIERGPIERGRMKRGRMKRGRVVIAPEPVIAKHEYSSMVDKER